MSAGVENLKQGGVWSRTRKASCGHKQAGIEWKAGELEFEALMRMLDKKVHYSIVTTLRLVL